MFLVCYQLHKNRYGYSSRGYILHFRICNVNIIVDLVIFLNICIQVIIFLLNILPYKYFM